MVGSVSWTGIQYSDTWWDPSARVGFNIQIHGGIGQPEWDSIFRYMMGSVSRSGTQYSDTWWDWLAAVGPNILIHDGEPIQPKYTIVSQIIRPILGHRKARMSLSRS